MGFSRFMFRQLSYLSESMPVVAIPEKKGTASNSGPLQVVCAVSEPELEAQPSCEFKLPCIDSAVTARICQTVDSTEIAAPRPPGFVAYGEWACGPILARKPRPTAVVAANDEVAFGLWRSFRRHDLQVPGSISLVGFDDREEATLMDPPLTTVRVRKEEIGQVCLRTLIERLRHPEMAFIDKTLSTDLVVRETVRKL